MGYALNAKIKELKPYEPIKGDYRIRLDANESFLDLPVEIHIDMIERMMHVQFNRYPDPLASGTCGLFAQYHGINPAIVTASNGSDELLSIITSTFLMKGEKLLTVTPDFSMYAFYGYLYENPVVEVKKGANLEIDVDEVIRVVKEENIRMVIFSNPCNPTGRGITKEEARRLITSVDALVVLDEAYMDFWDQSLIQETGQYDNLIILRTFSKAFRMAAVRLGFAVSNPVINRALQAVKSPYNVNSLTQTAASVLLKRPDEIRKAVKCVIQSRDELYAGAGRLAEKYDNKISLQESFTNFVFIKAANAAEIFDRLLVQGIAVRRMGEYLRVTAGSEKENKEFLDTLSVILAD